MQVLVNGMITGAGYALVALGFAVIFQTSRFFDFSFAAVLTVASYSMAYASGTFGVPLLVAATIGLSMGLLLGAAFEFAVYRRLRSKQSSSLVLILSSFGLMIATINTVSLIFGDGPRVVNDAESTQSIVVCSARLTTLQMTIMLISVVTAIACWWVFRYTPWGRIARAVADNEVLAVSVGVRTDRVVFQAVVFGSVLGALGAVLTALDTGLTPLLGFHLLLPGVVAAIIGGIGRISGAFFGGMAIGIVLQVGGWVVSTAWQDAILFVILILFLLLRPQGLFGRPPTRRSA
jgi:branched-chain amino acid transport system permease protein